MDERMPPLSQDDLPADLRAKLRIAIPGYELIDIIGRGGQATVYKGVDAGSGEKVAIKVLHDGPFAHESARQRLQRESIALKALRHPNIVCFLKSGNSPSGHEYLVMNYIEGRTLDQYWQDMGTAPGVPADPAALLTLFCRICEAVGAAHRSGITHRDLSPRNILVDHAGEPHILDFGLARSAFDAFLQPGKPEISFSGEFIGKFAYASPEQALGKNDAIDIRTDVYSLGVILYQILTGGLFPYEVGSGMAQTLKHIVESEPTPPSRLLASLAKGEKPRKVAKRHPPVVNEVIERIVLKTLEKEPGRRYQSAGELAQEIENYLAGRPTAAIAPRGREAGRGARWRKRLAVAGVLAIGAAVALFLWMGRARAPVQRPVPVAVERQEAASMPAATTGEAAGPAFSERVFTGHSGRPTSVLLLPERNMLITGSDSLYRVLQGRANINYPGDDHTVRFWDLRTGRQTSMIKNGLGAWGVHSLNASADGSMIVADTGHIGSGFDGFILTAWRTDNQQLLGTFHVRHPLAAHSAVFSADGSGLLALQNDSTILTMNLKTAAESTSAPFRAADGQSHDIGAWCMSSDRTLLFGARADNCVISVWNVADGKRMRDFAGHTDLVRTLSLSLDDRWLLSGSNDGTIRVWEVASGKELSQCRTGGPVVAASFAGPGHDRAVTGGSAPAATLWDTGTGKALKIFTGHTDAITALAVSRDGRLLATASADLTARTWAIPAPEKIPAATGGVDLLKIVDPVQDAHWGAWTVDNGALISNARGQQLEFPYAAPAEYDFRVSFVAPEVDVPLLEFFFPAGGRQNGWRLGDAANSACSFEIFPVPETNVTLKRAIRLIVPGQLNTVLLKVRKDHVEAHLNGALLCDYKTDYHEMGYPEWLQFQRRDTPGVMFNMPGVKMVGATIVDVTGTGKALRAPAASAGPADARHVDLLKLVDPAQDARNHGVWAVRDGKLVSQNPSGNELEFPYAVPAEYDYRVTFRPPKGVSHLMFFAPAGGHQIAWIAGARENTACGIELVDGKEAAQNVTTRWGSQWLAPGELNTVVLKVRKGHFEARLNGQVLCDYETDYHEIGLPEWVKWKRKDTVGVMFNVPEVEVTAAEVVEVSGGGTAVRGPGK